MATHAKRAVFLRSENLAVRDLAGRIGGFIATRVAEAGPCVHDNGLEAQYAGFPDVSQTQVCYNLT